MDSDPTLEHLANALDQVASSVQPVVDSAAQAASDVVVATGEQWELQAVALSLAGASALGAAYLGSRVLRSGMECCTKASMLMPLYDAGLLDRRPRLFRSRRQYDSLFGDVRLSRADASYVADRLVDRF